MHKSAMKCNKTICKWCKNKHGASKIIDTLETYHAPNKKEPLLLYIAATHQVVSTVLVVERSKEGKAHGVQRPLYFLSKVLSPTKQRYLHYQKLAYSVFTSA
jgi:hypothetical protein